MAQGTLTHGAPAGAKAIPSGVASKLRGLRSKINFWLLVDGLSKALAAAVVLLLLCFLADYYFNLDFSMRLGNLIISCAVLAFLVYRWLIVPFSARVSDDALVLAVEKHYGRETGDSLISAVQFSRMTNEIEVQGVSPQLVQATINQGTEAANRLPFGTVVDTRWLTANLGIFAVGAVLLGLYAYGAAAFRGPEHEDTSAEIVPIAFDREILLKDVPWPQDVYFTLNVSSEDGVIIVPRGDDLELKIRVREDSRYTADQIDEVAVSFIGTTTGRYTEIADSVRKKPAADASEDEEAASDEEGEDETGDAPADDETSDEESIGEDADALPIDYFSLDLPNVTEEFEFQIRARGVRGNSRWYQVKLVDRPDIEELKLTAKLPKYAGGADVELPPGAGPHHILAGSTLKIEATANKPLSSAHISVGDRTIDIDGAESFTAELSADDLKNHFTGGTISINLADQEDLVLPTQPQGGPLKSKRPTQFSLRIKPDRAPEVLAKLDGISGMVTPGAVIPFDCLIKDEFAITEVTINHQWKHEDDQEQNGQGKENIESVQEDLGERSIRFQDALELEPLQIPTGSGLSFFIAAVDNNDVAEEGPGEGKSTVFLLRVVTEAELRADLIRRQAEQRQDFERLYKQQQDYKTETQVLQAATRDSESLDAKQRDALRELQKNHKLLETNIGSIAKRLESIMQEMKNNQLDDGESELLQKLQDNVVTPMQELAKGDVNEAIKQLDSVRTSSDDKVQREEALDKAIQQQEQNEDKMAGILRNMAKTEGYQEAVNLFYEILKEEQRIKEMTEKERERLRNEIFEEVGGDTQPPEEEGENEE